MPSTFKKVEVLFKENAKAFEYGHNKRPISIESVLAIVEEAVRDKRVGHLRFVWPLKTGEGSPWRLMNIHVFLAIRSHFCPAKVSFDDVNLTEEERNDSSMYGKQEPNEVALLYLPLHPRVLLDKIREDLSCLESPIRLMCIGDFGNIKRSQLRDLVKNEKRLFIYRPVGENSDFKLSTLELKCSPSQHSCPPLHLETVIHPPALYEALHEDVQRTSLRSISTVEDVEHNLMILRRRVEAEELGAVGLRNLREKLNGRKINRIRVVGSGRFGYTHDTRGDNDWGLIELAMILTIKARYNVSTVTCQEPRLCQLELDYLRSIGIETPPCTEMAEAEEDVPDGEVVLAWMICPYPRVLNNYLWANRRQMDKIVFITNDNPYYRKWNLEEMSKKRALFPPVVAVAGAVGLTTLLKSSNFLKLTMAVAAFAGALYVTENFLRDDSSNVKQYCATLKFLQKAEKVAFPLSRAGHLQVPVVVMSYPGALLHELSNAKP
ncbi:hypothetical protein QR680_011368 [Steinernema hermaphroditum]|uniref:SRR1-like domain-containing protein n=1 Tax=Steinernema hermaphroditum TaxID=289476 RepID=A0AA39IS23_9BILA|nr:hypothetical protein QR680_011368 [Steinernema hermaphroditum]